jgi:predicted metal-dependent hydrolase
VTRSPQPAGSPSSVPFTVRRSIRARRARLTVTAEGEAVVVLPARAAHRIATELVHRNAGWLDRHIDRARARRALLAARPPLTEGRELLVGGIAHLVTVVPEPATRRSRVAVLEQRGAATVALRVHIGASDRRPVRALVEAWLRGRSASLIEARVAMLAAALGVRPSRVSVRAARQRWGSASHAGALSFNWRLVLAPPPVLDYVVVHELAHLVEPGHGRRFWSLVRAHAPNVDEARHWLRDHHAELMAALD